MPMGAPLVVSSAAETEMSSSPLTTVATTRKEDVGAGKSSWKTRFSSPSEQHEELESNSLAQNRMQRFSKKGMTTAVHSLRRLLPIKGKPPMANSTSNSVATHDAMEEDAYTAVATIPNPITSPRNNSPSNPQSPASLSEGNKIKSFRENKNDSTISKKKDLFDWQDQMEQQQQRELVLQKQWMKERDGFCRRVDTYDGSIIGLDGNKPTYELGNYLGGGVAGVVYEGHRLRPIEDYPVRTGISESGGSGGFMGLHRHPTFQKKPSANIVETPNQPAINLVVDDDGTVAPDLASSILCAAAPMAMATPAVDPARKGSATSNNRQTSTLSDGIKSVPSARTTSPPATPNKRRGHMAVDSVAIETTADPSNRVMLVEDQMDAPSRSEHYAKAAATVLNKPRNASFTDTTVDNTTVTAENASVSGLMEETVAIKILNPVGFRLMTSDVTQTCVVVREGERMDDEIKLGLKPMQEKHVWWLVHPNSRNLRTLQKDASKLRQNKGSSAGYELDRGAPDKGLRLSLLAAYMDPKTNKLKELPLTRCIEIWGHMPFAVSDTEFEDMMAAIDRVNAGMQPAPLPPFISQENYSSQPPSRVATGGTESTSDSAAGLSLDGVRVSNSVSTPFVFAPQRTGLYRVAYVQRQTVYCEDLHAYIGIPAVPSKYLRWLRQRRAATKEIRNMMLIGRHKNVVHLFEVLEYIQESKSTMFLILELVRGGELFDLISSSSSKAKSVEETECMMRKFFQELASGIHYCHSNGIAHRDLKPENLLVHTAPNGECTLKIADFGLSAAFGPNSQAISDQDTVMDSVASPHNVDNNDITSFASFNTRRNVPEKASPLKESINQIQALGSSALSLLTCGAMEDVLCNPNINQVEEEQPASPLRRMTSVVGSPHYVAPEIISQRDDGSRSSKKKSSSSLSSGPAVSKHRSGAAGYDGTKADVWSAGVILYAMLFRSLPFGEDLLRCPRFQSFRKWYDAARKQPGSRRANAFAALNPVITETEEREMLGPHWFFPSEASKESKDLIVAMLNPNPDDRLSIQMVMQHTWLRQER